MKILDNTNTLKYSLKLTNYSFHIYSCWSVYLINIQWNWVFATNSDFLIPISLQPIVLSMKCPIYEMSYLWIVLSMKCPIYEMSYLWNVLSMKCPFYEMSYLWNVLSMKCFSMNAAKSQRRQTLLVEFLERYKVRKNMLIIFIFWQI